VRFSSLAQLWWLVPLGGIIIALYLLRMRRKDQRVPATFLWPMRTEEVRANALIQKLRFNWLMVLQLLAMTFLVLALARPLSLRRGLTSDVTVFVIDVGASMGSVDVKPTRLAQARKEIEAAISGARLQDRIALIEAGPVPRVLCPLSSDKPRIRSALETATQTDAPSAMAEALRLASALCAGEAGARIVVVSDGVFPQVHDFSPGRAAVVYRKVGISDENMAVSALGLTEGDDGRQLYCAVNNYGHAPMTGAVTLYADGKVIDSRQLTVEAGKRNGYVLPVPPSSHVFEASLVDGDPLTADNYAAVVADSGSHLRILLVAAGGDPFLEKALALDPRVTLDKSESLPTSELATGSGQSQYDLVVFDGVPEVAVKAPAVLAFGAPGPASPAIGTSSSATKPTFTTAEDIPLMAGVDLQSTFIQSASVVKPRNGAMAVAEGRSSTGQVMPLIIESSLGRKQIYVPFRPGDSDFPLQFAFPIFISNALDFLGGDAAGGKMVVATGTPLSIPANSEVKLTDPGGVTRSIEPVGGSITVRGLDKVGAYKLASDGKVTTLFATLRDPVSSHIAPTEDLSLGSRDVVASTRPVRAWDLWRYGLLGALLMLVGEWCLFARRS
jgi:hypothetical protein